METNDDRMNVNGSDSERRGKAMEEIQCVGKEVLLKKEKEKGIERETK